MKHPLPSFVAVMLLSLGAASLGHAQKPVVPQPRPMPVPGMAPAPRPGLNNFASNANGAEGVQPLSSNYRVLFTGKSGDKAVGELSVLTSSRVVGISGPLDASPTPTSFDVSGTIEEREGGLIYFEYRIGFQVPVSTVTTTAQPNVPGGYSSNIQYQNHTCTGSLIMKPGKSYDILKAGGVTHSVTITSEPDK